MLVKDKDWLVVLWDIKFKLMLEVIFGSGSGVIDDVVNKIIMKLYKQCMEMYELYKQQNCEDLVVEEFFQVKVLEEYLFKMFIDDEICVIIVVKIIVVGVFGFFDMGKVMGLVNVEVVGKVDGKCVVEFVKEVLVK